LGDEVICGIRPEHLTLADAGLPAIVSVVEPTGSETHIVARHGSEEIVCLLRERVNVRPGQAIHLKMDASRSHLFDAGNGRRVQVTAPVQ
jgi:multiple sugar transport system ATP-binding protein